MANSHSDSNRAKQNPGTNTAEFPPRTVSLGRHASPGLTLLLLTVLAGASVTPVHGGLRDFSPPGIIQYGTCAQPKPHESFHFQQFSGLWHQVEMVPNSYMEATKCITMNFRWNGVSAYNVSTEGLNTYNERVRQGATITEVRPKEPGIKPYLQIRSPGVPRVPYHVVKTDYSGYACVYSCFELFSLMFEAFSVLSRDREITPAQLDVCYGAFDALGLDLTRLAPVEQQGDCLVESFEGSGESPEHQSGDQEDEDKGEGEEKEGGNALATLTSEEVNQSGPSNSASESRSRLTEGEGETIITEEEIEDPMENVQGVGEKSSSSSSSFSKTKDRTENEENEKPRNKTSRFGSGRFRDSQTKRPKKQPPRKSEEESGESSEEVGGAESQNYIDDLTFDGILREGKRGQDEAANEPQVTTPERNLIPREGSRKGGQGGGGEGRVVPTSLLLAALLSLALWFVRPGP